MPPKTDFRTDRHNNPTAFTTALAKQAGLAQLSDYEIGDSFTVAGKIYNTARLLKDPIALTLRVIDTVGFYNAGGRPRWDYIAIPDFVWQTLSQKIKIRIIQFMYHKEGGIALAKLFPSSEVI